MMIGHVVSGYLLRQMEFDADRYETRLVGGDVFESTARDLGKVGIAYQAALGSLRQYYSEGKLSDDLPALIEHNLQELPEEVKVKLAENIAEGKTGWFDTHPCDKDRIASAHRENMDGVFAVEGPAAEFFCNYHKLCQDVTWDFYQASLGGQVTQDKLKPTEQLLEHQRQLKAHREALERFLLGPLRINRPPLMPAVEIPLPDDPTAAIEELKMSRNEVLNEQRGVQLAAESLDKADEEWVEANAELALFRTRIVVPQEVAKSKSLHESQERLSACEATLRNDATKTEAYQQAMGRRLVIALQLLDLPQVAEKIAEPEKQRQQVKQLLPLAIQMGQQLPALLTFRNRLYCLSALFSQVEEYSSHEPLINSLLATADQLNQTLREVRESFRRVAYPFDHADANMSLGKYLVAELPVKGQLGMTHGVGTEFLDRFVHVYHRILSCLAISAEQVESALELSSLTKEESRAEIVFSKNQ